MKERGRTVRSAVRARKLDLQVSIVGRNPETLDGLHAYLESVGITAQSTTMPEAVDSSRSQLGAIVLFPDEFEELAPKAAADLLRAFPHLLLLIITSRPGRFASLDETGEGARTSILTKPTFGWTILDAIRTHAATAGHRTQGAMR